MKIKFRMAAWCAAAGRQYNEDNFQLKDDLSNPGWGIIKTDELVSLSEKGALLLVCDGMGGMNAGEVASALAVEAIQEWFSAERLTPQRLSSPEAIKQYIREAIIAADEKIKEDGKQNQDHTGMGSTLVLAWIVEKNVYVGWCGDSRAYRFNPAFGLEQLSHDHSYVQELVDEGKLSPELAFDHPDSNIITRSLGDNRHKVQPDVKSFPLYNGDIIMLCSDGLSGVLRDTEMKAIITKNTNAMENCREALWTESEKAGWTDNVTIALCQIVSGADPAPVHNKPKDNDNSNDHKKKRKMLTLLVALLLLFGLGVFVGLNIGDWMSKKDSQEELTKKCQEYLKKYTEADTLPTDLNKAMTGLRQLYDTTQKIPNADSILKVYQSQLEEFFEQRKEKSQEREEDEVPETAAGGTAAGETAAGGTAAGGTGSAATTTLDSKIEILKQEITDCINKLENKTCTEASLLKEELNLMLKTVTSKNYVTIKNRVDAIEKKLPSVCSNVTLITTDQPEIAPAPPDNPEQNEGDSTGSQ